MDVRYMLSHDLYDGRVYLWEKVGVIGSQFTDIATIIPKENGYVAMCKTPNHAQYIGRSIAESRPGELLEDFADRVYEMLSKVSGSARKHPATYSESTMALF